MIDDDDDEKPLIPITASVAKPALQTSSWPDVELVVEEKDPKTGKKLLTTSTVCTLRFIAPNPIATCRLPGPFSKLVLRMVIAPSVDGAEPSFTQVSQIYRLLYHHHLTPRVGLGKKLRDDQAVFDIRNACSRGREKGLNLSPPPQTAATTATHKPLFFLFPDI